MWKRSIQWDIKPYTNVRGRRRRGWDPRGRGETRRRRRTLSFVYGLMSHCIDRFHFVFYLYTFHFMLPMCIWLIFLFIILNYFTSGRVCPPGAFEKWILILRVFKMQKSEKTKKQRLLNRCALIVRKFWAIYLWKRLNGWSTFIKILNIKILLKL